MAGKGGHSSILQVNIVDMQTLNPASVKVKMYQFRPMVRCHYSLT